MKFFDAFSGYGGFHLGIERAYESLNSGEQKSIRQRNGWEDIQQSGNSSESMCDGEKPKTEQGHRICEWVCIGYSEIDKYASAVYKYHFGGTNYGDIRNIRSEAIPDFQLFCGGFPCQAFSIAGKRGGFNDTRGTLFFEIARILKSKQPRHVLLENVKGLLSHDGGRTFKTIISSLAELGYSVEWQVLNAKNFGVPQNRERVFIIGHLGGFSGRQVFPIRGENQICTGRDEKQKAICQTLKRRYPDDWNGNHIVEKPIMRDGRDNRSCLRSGRTPEVGYKGYSIRRLTPTECERLMGLPDDWTSKGDFDGEIKDISDTQRYKLCGNGVVVNVVEEIIKRLYGKDTV